MIVWLPYELEDDYHAVPEVIGVFATEDAAVMHALELPESTFGGVEYIIKEWPVSGLNVAEQLSGKAVP